MWRPYDDKNDETATGASRLAISSDGNLFAPGDVRGTVKVYTTSDFCLLYQLASEDPVLSLVFSPDPHRFYDIRGCYGNAWEPNALMRFAEQRSRSIESVRQKVWDKVLWHGKACLGGLTLSQSLHARLSVVFIAVVRRKERSGCMTRSEGSLPTFTGPKAF